MAFVPEKGTEPIPGYQLVQRLGVGGYGEVWLASAPGDLPKAIKIVYGKIGDAWAEQELKALHRMKEVRHPFLLSLERYEIINEQLFIVTEMAEKSMMERFTECRASGLPGIPREELLAFVRDASDALDYMNESYGLQHQDIKPQNLLIASGRVKVADFGLVKNLVGNSATATGGVTPIYAPPEAFDGRVSRFSDQYSLAIVYQEMLTGVRPFPGSTPLQLATQHTTSPPLLYPLPPGDRPVIARALAKVPEQRYPTCCEMAEALSKARTAAPARKAPPHVPFKPPPVDQSAPNAPVPSAPSSQTLLDDGWTRMPGRDKKSSTDERGERPEPAACPVNGPLEPPDDHDTVHVPTLLIGIGGLAIQVLRHLRVHLHDDLNPAQAPAPRFLILDTDRSALLSAIEGKYDESLAADEILHVPLRRSEHHRARANDLLRWLDRRWLYGIPRSQMTEGIRALGRLAFVDNAEEVLSRLRTVLSQLHAQVRKSPQSGADCPSPKPAAHQARIHLVASLGGGAGSGMLIDVAYALRQLLSDMQVPSDGVRAILLHTTSQKPTARALARINAFATLKELSHFHNPTAMYPGEPPVGLWPQGAAQPPFQQCYLVHLGDDLNHTDIERSAGNVAEYLRLNLASPVGLLSERFRIQTTPSPDEQWGREATLRTFGVCRLTFPRNTLAKMVTNLFCQHVVKRWRSLDAKHSKAILEECSRKAATWGIEPEALARHFCSAAESVWGAPAETHFKKFVAGLPLCNGPLPEQPKLGELTREAMRSVDVLLGDGAPGGVTLSLCQTLLLGRARELCVSLGKSVVEWLVSLLEDPNYRVVPADRASQALGQELIAKSAKAQERRSQAIERRDQIRGQLRSGEVGERGGIQRLIKSGFRQDRSKGPIDLLLEYCSVKLMIIAWERTLEVLGAVSRHVAEFRENLVLCQQQLRHLAELFTADHAKLIPTPGQEGVTRGVVKLLPGQAANLPLAALAIMDALPRETIQEFEAQFQTDVLVRRGGLMGLVADYGTSLHSIQQELETRAMTIAWEQIATVDAAQLYLEQCGDADQTKANLQELWKTAAPRLNIGDAWQHVILAVPDTYPGDVIRNLTTELFPETPVSVVKSDGDVVVCLEVANLTCPRVADALIGDLVPPPEIVGRLLTRRDVVWAPLLEREGATPTPAAELFEQSPPTK